MTRVKFLKDGSIIGFEILSHSTTDADDSEGKTVCAAVSSAAYMAANTIIEIIGDKCFVTLDDAKMLVTVDAPCKETVVVLDGLKLHLTELSKQYSKRIKIITEV